jgi:2-oxo-4-hydroxy-4-carboxy-5-ureidoimidazoline decarboxylase
MNTVLDEWNKADENSATDAMLACCGARRWAERMVARRPISSLAELSEAADREWSSMLEPDWLEAFVCHPRIGERKLPAAPVRSGAWSEQEQSGIKAASTSILRDLAEANALYEQRFGFTYIVCATGKSPDELLVLLNRRLARDRMAELKEAAEQQRQIMQIRLGKWLLS